MLGTRHSPGALTDAFGPLPRQARRALERSVEHVRLTTGDVLYRADESARWAWVVCEGSIAVGHRLLPSRHRGPGQWVGIVETLRHDVYSDIAWAEEPSLLLAVGVRELKALMDRVPAITSTVLRAVLTEAVDARSERSHANAAAQVVRCGDRTRAIRAA